MAKLAASADLCFRRAIVLRFFSRIVTRGLINGRRWTVSTIEQRHLAAAQHLCQSVDVTIDARSCGVMLRTRYGPRGDIDCADRNARA